jgi:hypothetical protein
MPRPRGDATSAFQLRLRPTVKQALTEAAARNSRSVNSEIAARLEVSLQHEDEQEGEDVRRLLRALGQVMATAGERAAEFVPGKPDWMDDGWAYAQAAAAVALLLAALRPPGAIKPPVVKVRPELIEEFGSEERALRFAEGVRDRTGVSVVEYLLGGGRGTFYAGAEEFQQRILGPKLAARPKANKEDGR